MEVEISVKNLSKNYYFLDYGIQTAEWKEIVVRPSFSIISRKSDVFSGEFWLHCTYTNFNEHRPVSLLTHLLLMVHKLIRYLSLLSQFEDNS